MSPETFQCHAFEGPKMDLRFTRKSTPEELRPRLQEKYDKLFGGDAKTENFAPVDVRIFKKNG